MDAFMDWPFVESRASFRKMFDEQTQLELEMKRTQYITIAPRTKNGKWQILSRKLGSKDRYQFIAEAINEIVAEKIISALNASWAEVLAPSSMQAAE